MANIARIRLPGFWVPNSVVDPDEFEDLDEIRPWLANFSTGSSHTPSGFVTVGGSGFQFTGTGHEVAASGRVTVQSTGEIRVASGGLIRLDGTSADIDLKVTAGTPLIDVGNGCAVRILSGGSLDVFGTATIKNTSGPGSIVMEANTSLAVNSAATVALNSAEVSGGKFSHPIVLIATDTSTRVHGVTWGFKAGEFLENADDAYLTTVNDTGEVARTPLQIPNGAVLNTVSVTLRGATFYSALPDTLPVVTVYKVNHVTGVKTTLGTQVDTSATFGDYQTVHQITVSGLAATIARNVETVWVKIATETGANSYAGTRLYRTLGTSVSIASVNGHD